MSNIVIEAENISKMYRLGTVGTGTISHDLNRFWHKVRGKEDPYLKIGQTNDRTQKADGDYVWALKDINFSVGKGDVLGIIGKNGAGKSTLLKILSRVTSPSTGEIRIKGRIASLLEVGTGFHPELTGRENVFQNGALLGMRRHEIQAKLDEIVAFSGIEKYIDTPVKRYSSGMYVRLAFAVAAHLEPEILIVDEVLAVGDADFQKKCLGKMKDVSTSEGRTVLFVSHNMAAVKQLCTSGIVIENGGVAFSGTSLEAVNYYQQSGSRNNYFIHKKDQGDAPGNENIRIIEFGVLPAIGDVISISSGIEFVLKFINSKPNINLDLTFELRTMDEQVVFHTGHIISNQLDSKEGIYELRGKLPENLLNAGTYYICLIFGENQRYVLYTNDSLVRFDVMNESFGYNASLLPGIIRPNLNFSVTQKAL